MKLSTTILPVLALVTTAAAQSPTHVELVVKVGDTPSGAGGATVSTLNAPFTDGNGKVGFTGNLNPSNNFVWYGAGVHWLNSDGLPDVLTGAEGTMGVSNTGDFIYSPSTNGNDSVWTSAGLLAQTGTPAPGHPGQYITFASRPIMLPDGTAYFVSGLNPTQGSTSTQRRTIFKTVSGVLTLVQTGGDVVGGFTIANTGIEFGYDVADNDQHIIQQLTMTGVPTTGDSFIYVNNAAAAREGDPTGQGANWQTFAGMSINNSGNYVFGGDDSGAAASDAFVAYNSNIVVREGQTIDGFLIASGSSIGWVSINNLNKVAYIWNRTGFDALFVGDGPNLAATSKLLLKVGDVVDLNNDNIGDATVIDFEASASISPGLSFSDHNFIHVEVTLRDIGQATDYEAIIRVPIPVPCPADISGDGNVNVTDLLAVINNWGACSRPCPPHCAADVNHDCAVNVTDLLAVIVAWGPCP